MNVTSMRSYPRPSPFALAVAAGLSLAAGAVAGPGVSGGQVVSGSGSIHRNGANTTIHAGNNAIIHFDSFSIGAGESVRFVQPSSTSRVLNRVTGPDPSTIAGSLQSNGIVYIANPAGVYFANGALVNVGGIYAAAGRISNADFLSNLNRFSMSGATGTVENHGFISGSQVHLLGQRVANFGTIVAPGSAGIVTMTAGDEVMIGRTGGQIMARVSGGGANSGGGAAGVTQAGQIDAGRKGRISIGAGDMYALAVDHRGTSRARDITVQGGETGVVSVAGMLDASSESGRGGTIKVLGEKVGIMGAEIDASGAKGGGTVLIGGGRMGQGPERNAAATYISEDSVISADATAHGKGGTVIAWSDQVSRIYGRLSARGGVAGGDGGFVETSSARELHVSRTPDVTVRAIGDQWRGGTWLIDPEDLTIVPGGGQTNIGTTPPPPASIFESTGADAELGVDLIVAALTGGANVEVRTGAGGATDGGTITLRDDVDLDYDGTGFNTLSLIAHGDIVMDGRVRDSDRTAGNDTLNLVLMADSDGSGSGEVYLNNVLDTGGGSLTVNGEGLNVGEESSILTRGGDVLVDLAENGIAALNAGINAGPGSITFENAVFVQNDVTLRAGEITFNGGIAGSPFGTSRLTLNTINDGATRFNGPVGSPDPLDALTTNADGTTFVNADFIRAREMVFNNPVVLEADASFRSDGTGRFAQTVTSAAGQLFDLSTGGTGAITFAVDVGDATDGRIGTLTTETTGTTIYQGAILATTFEPRNNVTLSGGTVNTTGDQVFDGSTTVAVDTVLTGANITFNGRINSPLTSDHSLTINTSGGGVTTFNGAVGEDIPLRLITTNADGTTVFAGGSISTSGEQNFNDPVLVSGNTSVTGGRVIFHETVDSDSTPQSLEVSVTELVRFTGAVGQQNPLFTLSVSPGGGTEINGGAVTTTGAQVYNNAVLIGDDTVLAGSGVSFGSTLNSDDFPSELTINTTGNGLTTFNGTVGATTPLLSLTTNADGTTRLLGPSVVTTQSQTYNDAVLLGDGTVTVTGNALSFMSSINSSSLFGEGSLIANTTAAGVTTFGGPIGNINPIENLTTNASGTTRIGADITTVGSMTFNDSVVLTGDASLRETGDGSIIFAGTINSDGTPRALTLRVNTEADATPAAPQLPRIVFGGNIGSTSALRSLRLGGDRSAPATAATIVAGLNASGAPINNFTMNIDTTQGVTMGRYQRFTTLGSLNIDAGGPVVIGDISALGDVNITAPDIRVQTRPEGQVLVRDGSSLVLRNDPSVDIVAGGSIDFSTAPTVLGEFNRPSFGTPEGSEISATLADFVLRAIGPVTIDQLRLNTVVLDLRAAGPGNTNVAEAIAGAVPRVEVAASPDAVAHGNTQLAELEELGIATETEDQALPFLTGVVEDDATGLVAGEARVSPRRLPPGAVAEVLADYRVLFYGERNPETLDPAVRDERIALISSTLRESWNEYAKAAGDRADPVGFRAYVEAVPAEAETLHYLNSLRDLFTEMGYLGLTTADVRSARQEIVRAIAFPEMTPAQLETAIMATFLGSGTPRQR